MPDVKRRVAKRQPYRSALRAAQARQTRLRILDAASGLFAERGYVAATMDAIAAAAGVAVDTVYAAFGAKRGLLSALIDQGVIGPDATGPVLEQEAPQAVFRERDARRQVAMFAAETSLTGRFVTGFSAAHSPPELWYLSKETCPVTPT